MSSWASILGDSSQALGLRMRAVFELRSEGSEEAVSALCGAVCAKEEGTLLRHEAAFALGQLRAVAAAPTLERVLGDTAEDEIVRHEAGEALGAIGLERSVPVLEKGAADASRAVAETCALALRSLEWQREHGRGSVEAKGDGVSSVDPAPAAGSADASIESLSATLLAQDKSMFDRYCALFRLRDLALERKSEEAAVAIASALEGGVEDSALLLHEVAYVLGQLQDPKTLPWLQKAARNEKLHPMVRHEAVEAMAGAGDDGLAATRDMLEDPARIVRESAQVAVDAAKYWEHFDESRPAAAEGGGEGVKEAEME